METVCNCNLDCNQEIQLVYKGSTPIFNFNVCLAMEEVDIANTHIIFTSGPTTIDKTNQDIEVKEGILSCSLTQEETMSFKGTQVNIQILATMASGQKPASVIMTVPVSSTLLGGVAW